MNNKRPDNRPVFLNILRIRQPITAYASIAHRISGILLFISIPFAIWLLDRSLRSSADFQYVIELFSQPLIKMVVVLLSWSLAHHFFAGLRFLLLDVDVGIELAAARRSAMLVNILGVLGALATLAVIL